MNSMEVEEIREKIESDFDEILASKENLKFSIGSNAYGHSAGDSIEGWLKTNFLKKGWNVYYTHEFLFEVFQIIGKDEKKLIKFLDNIWWGKFSIYKKGQITNFIKGVPIGTYQQAGADIVLFYGTDLKKEPEKVILLNAKSHNITRRSRAPNIMSAQRLLEFFNDILGKGKMINDAEYWFVGVNYDNNNDDTGEVKQIYIKDLFKIDVTKISQINFDAAIQIQCHVEDMQEIKQSKLEFIERISNLFIETWRKHSERKTIKYEKLVNNIFSLLKRS